MRLARRSRTPRRFLARSLLMDFFHVGREASHLPRRVPMLVLTRKTQQQIQIGDNITITVVRVKGESVRIGIAAPHEVRVMRAELTKKAAENPAQPVSEAAAPQSPAAPTTALPSGNLCSDSD